MPSFPNQKEDKMKKPKDSKPKEPKVEKAPAVAPPEKPLPRSKQRGGRPHRSGRGA